MPYYNCEVMFVYIYSLQKLLNEKKTPKQKSLFSAMCVCMLCVNIIETLLCYQLLALIKYLVEANQHLVMMCT